MENRKTTAAYRRKKMDELRQVARAQGWEVVSRRYCGVTANYTFKCDYGHKFEATMHTVAAGYLVWCPHCKAEMKAQAQATKTPVPVKAPAPVAAPKKVKAKPQPKISKAEQKAKEAKTSRLYRLHATAHNNGGRCLDGQPKGANALYGFSCEKKHTFHLSADALLAGKWCPQCTPTVPSLADKLQARAETILGKSKGIEIPGLSMVDLEAAPAIDKDKLIALIGRLPGSRNVGIDINLPLSEQMKVLGLQVKTRNAEVPQVVEAPTEKRGRQVIPAIQMAKLQAVVHLRGGKLLDTEYKGTGAKYRFSCKHGHEWETQYGNVVKTNGSWCQKCALKAIAENKRK